MDGSLPGLSAEGPGSTLQLWPFIGRYWGEVPANRQGPYD